MKTSEVLDGAIALVTKGWCQGSNARDQFGVSVPSYDPKACAWCVYGAVYRASGITDEKNWSETQADPAVRLIRYEVKCATDGAEDGISVWNDSDDRTVEDVVRVLTRARDKAKEAECAV